MDFHEFKEAIFSILPEHDPYKAAKQVHLRNWCGAYHKELGLADNSKCISFFLDLLSDEECWEESDTVHRIKLNRRIAATKMVQPLSSKGTPNPLEEIDRYKIACYCCLEEDATILFENYKRNAIRAANKTDMKKAVIQFIIKDFSTDPMMNYWSYIVSGYASELQLSGKHLYEHGLSLALGSYVVYVEAIEFFWDKIKSLPNDELSDQQKNEIFMKTILTTTEMRFSRNPEVFEFCFSQMTSDNYRNLLRKDFAENEDFVTLAALVDNFRFDLYQKLFDCFRPHDIGQIDFFRQLSLLEIEEYPEYYAKEAVKLFMHMWMKEGFDHQRSFVLFKEMTDRRNPGKFLIPFIKKNYMAPVWAIMDKADCFELKTFMESEKASYICYVLKERGDEHSLTKFLSYKPIAEKSNAIDLLDLSIQPLMKKSRTE